MFGHTYAECFNMDEPVFESRVDTSYTVLNHNEYYINDVYSLPGLYQTISDLCRAYCCCIMVRCAVGFVMNNLMLIGRLHDEPLIE